MLWPQGGFNASRQAAWTGPDNGKCASVTSANDVCTWGCQSSYEVERDRFGCCYSLLRTQLVDLGCVLLLLMKGRSYCVNVCVSV